MKRNIQKLTILFSVLLLLGSVTSAAGSSGLSPTEALARIEAGNARFTSGNSQHPDTSASRMRETSTNGQHPYVTLITCSDSRVPVERVFDEGIGDIFVIRVAGNVCDTDEIGSIEYGVDHLSTPLMVVLGHTQCGAVTAVATGAEVHGSIPALVDNIAPAVRRAEGLTGLHGDDVVDTAIRENVWQSVSDLLESSSATRNLVRSHQLKIVGAVYHIEDGHVEWLGEHPEQARLAASTAPDTHAPATDTHASPPPTPPASSSSHEPAVEETHAADGAEESAEEAHGEKGELTDAETIKVLTVAVHQLNKMMMFVILGMIVLALGVAGVGAHTLLKKK